MESLLTTPINVSGSGQLPFVQKERNKQKDKIVNMNNRWKLLKESVEGITYRVKGTINEDYGKA